MKTQVLKLLKDTDGFVSGQELCERFGVSRTAVWKAVHALQAEGFEIEAVRNRGYRLKSSSEIYSQAGLASTLKTKWLGRRLVFLEEVDSTNNQVKRMAADGAPEGTVVVAQRQTAGKGRRGRSWVSDGWMGIWMSFLLRPQFPPECASMLTLVTALAVAGGIRETTGLESKIKWPNDIVVNGKKLCGILTEMSCDMDSIQYIVVGIGINVGKRTFPEEIRETATALEMETDVSVNRTILAGAVLRSWEDYYDTFLGTENFSLLKEEYNQNLVNFGREVKVLSQKGDYVGVSHGITNTGELTVQLADGNMRTVVSGEVSVRGVYGYV